MTQPPPGDHADRAVLSADDVRRVVENYAIARPITMRQIGLGSRAIAKSKLTTPRGEYLLKRRAPHRSGMELVEFVHAFQRHLEARSVQIAPLMLDRLGRSAVPMGGHVFELFGWMPGQRWTRTTQEAGEAGLAFGRMLRAAQGYMPEGETPSATFHAHAALATALRLAPAAAAAADPDTDQAALASLCQRLGQRAARASERADCIRSLPTGVVHGDLHPGNVLFEGGQLRAILDFDGARVDWRVCELANAALHFGNDPIAGVPVEEWDPALDIGRTRALLAGAERGMGSPLSAVEREALPWLMIEACTLESSVPVARTGRFAHLRADALLTFVDRKAQWIEDHARDLETR